MQDGTDMSGGAITRRQAILAAGAVASAAAMPDTALAQAKKLARPVALRRRQIS